MAIWMELKRLWAGYPGGYQSRRRALHPVGKALPFRQPTDPNDLRSKIPPLGHREYWYPALPDKDVKWKKPQVLRMLGQDLVFFRGKDGGVKALLDACPHRGAFLSPGRLLLQRLHHLPLPRRHLRRRRQLRRDAHRGPRLEAVG